MHVTGTGTVQEQFIHYLAESPQFKNTVAKECTSIKMSDERLVQFISGKFKQAAVLIQRIRTLVDVGPEAGERGLRGKWEEVNSVKICTLTPFFGKAG